MAHETPHMKQSIEENNKALVRKACDAWVAGTGTPYDLLAEDMTWTIIGETVVDSVYESKASFMQDVMRPFANRIIGRLTPSVRGIYAEGQSIVLRADVEGTALDGKPYQNQYAWFLEMRDDRIQNVVAFIDVKAFNELFQRVTPRSGSAG